MCGKLAALPATPPHRPRSLPVPGFEGNVLLLRDPAQANAIATMAEGKRVVVIGTSFIGEALSLKIVSANIQIIHSLCKFNY